MVRRCGALPGSAAVDYDLRAERRDADHPGLIADAEGPGRSPRSTPATRRLPSGGRRARGRSSRHREGKERAMKLGLTVWGFAIGVRASVDLAVLAEQRGFDSVLMVEGVFSNDAMTAVAAMAGRTSRILIGTGIANVYLRHPVMLGLAAAAIAELSEGRLVLGLGPNNEAMISRAGLTWRDPREALRDTTATLRDVFAGKGLPGLRPLQPAAHAIPVHWAAMALETCEAAGRHADGLMLYLCSRERYRRAMERMGRGATAAGRRPGDVEVSLLIPAFVHDDLPIAREAAREFLVHYAGMPHYA